MQENKAWQDAGLPAVAADRHVSALQFRVQDFPEKVAAVCWDTDSRQVPELEDYRSVIMHGQETAIEQCAGSRRWGVKLSSTFGRLFGLSSLKQFPIDPTEADQSIWRGL